MSTFLKRFWCDWFHGGGDIKRDKRDRINWQCRKCGRWADPVTPGDEVAVASAGLEQLERATVKKSLPVDCPACGGGGLLPDPTWDWVRCDVCNPRRAAIAKAEGK